MRASAFFIAIEPPKAYVARVLNGHEVEAKEVLCDDSETTSDALAAALKEALGTLGYDGSGVCLGIPSGMTLAAPVDCENLPRKGRHEALLYRLEDHLPIDAEQVTADFLPPAGGRALGIAVETAPLKELVDRLAEAGVETVAICPTALLALWEVTRGAPEICDYRILASSGSIDVFRMAEHRPVAWHLTPPDAADVVRSIQVDLLARPAESDTLAASAAGPVAEDLLDEVHQKTGVKCQPQGDESLVELAARAASALIDGEVAGWVNLRRDALAMPNPLGRLARPLAVAVALLVALLVGVTGAGYLRAARYQALAAGSNREQTRIYERLYPNTRVPPNVRSRLRSEAARLEGLSGAGDPLPRQGCALETLRSIVRSLPSDVRLRIVDLRIDAGGILIEGQTRSHADAETLSRSLQQTAGFAMESPRTEHLVKGGVTFTLVGRPGGQTPSAPAREN